MNTLPWLLHQLEHVKPSVIACHPSVCCQGSRRWVQMMILSQASSTAALSWIGQQWAWGPAHWPLYWCDLPRLTHLDCGAHAALGRESCALLGVEGVAVQLVQLYDALTVEHWRRRWTAAGAIPGWLYDPFVYHEVLGFRDAGSGLLVWDVSERQRSQLIPEGYGSTAAIRIARSFGSAAVSWEGRLIPAGVWQPLGTMDTRSTAAASLARRGK
jgi:hypothetical protein